MTPLTVRWPTERRVPSARTTLSASTASRVTPYLAHRRPPAFMAMFPPTVEMSLLAGSGVHHRPCSARALLRSPLRMPGWTTASRFAAETSRIRSMSLRDSTISPGPAMAPPASPVPAPRLTIGTPAAEAIRHTACTSSTLVGYTAARGVPDERWPERSVVYGRSCSGSASTRPGRAARRDSTTAGSWARGMEVLRSGPGIRPRCATWRACTAAASSRTRRRVRGRPAGRSADRGGTRGPP